MKKSAVFLMILFLSACFSSTPNSRFYLLESSINSVPVSSKQTSIAIQDIQIPDYLDRPQIVLQQQDNPELKIAEFDRWASDLGGMLQNTLAENLQKELPNAVIQPLSYGINPRYIVKVNIEKLSGWLDENVYLNGSWQIVNSNGKVLAEQTISLSASTGKTYNSYVKAQSRLWAQTASQIVAALVKL